MNSKKLITILIFFFLIINIALFRYDSYKDKKNHTLSNERIEQLRQILDKNNILIYDYIPDFYPKSRLIITRPEDFELELVEDFFDKEDRSTDYENDIHRHSDNENKEDETKHVTFEQGDGKGNIYYGTSRPTYKASEYDSRSSRLKIAEEFMKTFTLDKGVFELTDERMAEKKAFYLYYFNERFEGELLFCNEVVIKVEESGITEARTIRYIPYEFEKEKQKIYPIDEVLYKFMIFVKEEDLGHIRITDIDLGYDLGQDSRGKDTYTYVEPYYRIKIGSGQTYYINAYTNTLLSD